MSALTRLDLPFRFQRALEPDGLSIVQTCSAALADALAEARYAGYNPETDPAVLLLGRHLGRIAAGQSADSVRPEDAALREACKIRIAELRASPMLVPLVRKGLNQNPDRIRLYQYSARDALQSLARTLCLGQADYEIRRDRHFTSDNPAITLFAEDFSVTIDPCRLNPGRELAWVRANGRAGPWAGRSQRGPIDYLSNITRFAATLRRDCNLQLVRRHHNN
ncbi:MAG: hypothetical protein WBA51_14805 [Erythrobacter sp.]